MSLLCEALPPSERDALAFRWIDRCVRVHAPTALERCGYVEHARTIRALPEIRSAEDFGAGEAALLDAARVMLGESDDERGVLAGLFALSTVRRSFGDESVDLEGVVITTVTSARCMGATNEEQEQAADVKAAARGR